VLGALDGREHRADECDGGAAERESRRSLAGRDRDPEGHDRAARDERRDDAHRPE